MCAGACTAHANLNATLDILSDAFFAIVKHFLIENEKIEAITPVGLDVTPKKNLIFFLFSQEVLQNGKNGSKMVKI